LSEYMKNRLYEDRNFSVKSVI